MNDLETLRDGWGEPMPPSHAAFAEARAALLERAAADRAPAPVQERRSRFRLPRTGARLVAVGALAVTIAAGVTVAQNVGGVDENGKPRQVVPGLPAGPVANAQEALYRAANAAESKVFVGPRADQWVYLETRYRAPEKPGAGQVQTPKTPAKTWVDRYWTRGDGNRIAVYEKGKLVISPSGGGGNPPTDYAVLAALPRDPDKLLEWAYKIDSPNQGTKDGRDSTAWSMLLSIMHNRLVPSQQVATIYRAMAKIPGVSLVKDAGTVNGHPALAVARVIEGWVRQEIVLDRKTYAYLGGQDVAVKDHSESVPEGGKWTIKKGAVIQSSVRLGAGVVDKPGQRP